MFDIIIIGYLAYRNGVRAKLKGKKPVLWIISTVMAYLLCMAIGLYVVIYNFCKDDINLNQISSSDKNVREAAAQQLIQSFSRNPIHLITIELFGIGGYLLIRYILERKADKKPIEVHWMDKMGEKE